MEMLAIRHVSKSFGSRKIIDDVSFSVEENTIFGFVGENGAGKTTTMRMILGLLRADEGKIFVNGEPVSFGQNKTNRYIGYLPDVPEFYDFMTPMEYLDLCRQVTGMEKKDFQEKAAQLLKLVGLSGENKRIHGFSRGMKQRFGIFRRSRVSPVLRAWHDSGTERVCAYVSDEYVRIAHKELHAGGFLPCSRGDVGADSHLRGCGNDGIQSKRAVNKA